MTAFLLLRIATSRGVSSHCTGGAASLMTGRVCTRRVTNRSSADWLVPVGRKVGSRTRVFPIMLVLREGGALRPLGLLHRWCQLKERSGYRIMMSLRHMMSLLKGICHRMKLVLSHRSVLLAERVE